jgi:hypothetical protein
MPSSITTLFEGEKKLISKETESIKTIPKYKKKYYQNIITYLDEYIYFNYLKLTNPDFGFIFSSMLDHYIKADVTVSFPLIVYQRRYPDDETIDPYKLTIIEEELNLLFE